MLNMSIDPETGELIQPDASSGRSMLVALCLALSFLGGIAKFAATAHDRQAQIPAAVDPTRSFIPQPGEPGYDAFRRSVERDFASMGIFVVETLAIDLESGRATESSLEVDTRQFGIPDNVHDQMERQQMCDHGDATHKCEYGYADIDITNGDPAAFEATWLKGASESRDRPRAERTVTPDMIDRDQVAQHLFTLAAARPGFEPRDVTLNTHMMNDLGWDFLDVVEYVMDIEEAFEVPIPFEQIESAGTIRDVLEMLLPVLCTQQ